MSPSKIVAILFIIFSANLFAKILVIKPGQSIQNIIKTSPDGTVLQLQDGVYTGNFIIDKPITLQGSGHSIIRSSGMGTTIRLQADHSKILNVTIDGSGTRYDLKDAAIFVEGDHCVVQNTLITNATYGIVVEKSTHVLVESNTIYGNGRASLGLRGDAIRFWETRLSKIRYNTVYATKDVIIWYSYQNEIVGNLVSGSRYGTHFMYSHQNLIQGNRYVSNVVGMFVMYSRELLIQSNLYAHSAGAAGYGVGVKESGDLNVIHNHFIKNTVGLYLDVSPYDARQHNFFISNQIVFCQKGILFHGTPKQNTFKRNLFFNNRSHVNVDGGGTSQQVNWQHNYYDTYLGYDFDKDGLGDIPYELRSFSQDILSRYHSVALFEGTLSLKLINFMGKIFPLLQPKLILVDPQPQFGK